MIWLAACAAVAAAVEDVPPLTVVSGANGRYALKELAVLLDIKDRARQAAPATGSAERAVGER